MTDLAHLLKDMRGHTPTKTQKAYLEEHLKHFPSARLSFKKTKFNVIKNQWDYKEENEPTCEDMANLFNALNNCPNIYKLDTMGFPLSPEITLSIIKALKTNRTLQSILFYNQLTPLCIKALGKVLIKNLILTHLKLNINHNHPMLSILAPYLNRSHITDLVLFINIPDIKEDMIALCQTLQSNKTLLNLTLYGSPINLATIDSIRMLLKSRPALASLSLHQIPQETIPALIERVINSHLKKLKLSPVLSQIRNNIESIIHLIKSDSALKAFSLQHTDMTPADSKKIAYALRFNTHLEDLNLGYHQFIDNSLLSFAIAYATHPSLSRIKFRYSTYDKASLEALSYFVKKCTTRLFTSKGFVLSFYPCDPIENRELMRLAFSHHAQAMTCYKIKEALGAILPPVITHLIGDYGVDLSLPPPIQFSRPSLSMSPLVVEKEKGPRAGCALM